LIGVVVCGFGLADSLTPGCAFGFAEPPATQAVSMPSVASAARPAKTTLDRERTCAS
jgi:hypothetical protein